MWPFHGNYCWSEEDYGFPMVTTADWKTDLICGWGLSLAIIPIGVWCLPLASRFYKGVVMNCDGCLSLVILLIWGWGHYLGKYFWLEDDCDLWLWPFLCNTSDLGVVAFPWQVLLIRVWTWFVVVNLSLAILLSWWWLWSVVMVLPLIWEWL